MVWDNLLLEKSPGRFAKHVMVLRKNTARADIEELISE
jgi:hypothetical protein